MQCLKISKDVVLDLKVILLDLIFGAVVALPIVGLPKVVLFQGLLDIVLCAHCLLPLLTLYSLFLLDLVPDLIGRETFEPLLF
jgi:hypothetical protein